MNARGMFLLAALPLLAGPSRAESGLAPLYASASRSAAVWEAGSCLTSVEYLAGTPSVDPGTPVLDALKLRFMSRRNPRWNLELDYQVPAGSQETPPDSPGRETSHRPFPTCVPEPERLMAPLEALRVAIQRGFKVPARPRLRLMIVTADLPMFSTPLFRNLDGAPVWMLDGKEESWVLDGAEGKVYLRVPMDDPEAAVKMADYPERPVATEPPSSEPSTRRISSGVAIPCRVAEKYVDQEAGNGGCWIWVDDKILVLKRKVRDVDGRLMTVLDFPGGLAAKGERAQCAAHRHTAEDIGRDVEVGRLVRVFKGEYHLYECALGPRDAAAKSFNVPKARAGEILKILLVPPSTLEGGQIWSTR